MSGTTLGGDPDWIADLRSVVREGSAFLVRLDAMNVDDAHAIPGTETHEYNDMGVEGETVFKLPLNQLRSLLDELAKERPWWKRF